MPTEYPVDWNDPYQPSPDTEPAVLVVNVTDEGVILDLIRDDEVVVTWGRTAQEIVDTLLLGL